MLGSSFCIERLKEIGDGVAGFAFIEIDINIESLFTLPDSKTVNSRAIERVGNNDNHSGGSGEGDILGREKGVECGADRESGSIVTVEIFLGALSIGVDITHSDVGAAADNNLA